MKKFGTPTWAGLGSARLKEGLVGLGMPLGWRGGGALVDGEEGLLGLDGCELDGELGWLLGEEGVGFEWPLPGCLGGGVDLGFGGGGGEGFFGGGGVEWVGGGVLLVVVGVCGQDSWMLTTPAGNLSVDGGTPGGSWK
jgi:hypothetical protein